MSYIDIPLTNEHIFFELINHQTNDPVVNPQFPMGIGRNFGTLYDLGCGIKIHDILSAYNLPFSVLTDVTLYLCGNNGVGDMKVYSTSGEIGDSPIEPSTFDYEIPLEDTYDSTYCGYLFKMSTLNATEYSVFNNYFSYIRIEYPNVTNIYVDPSSKKRYFNLEKIYKTDFVVKAVLSNSTEFTLTDFTSPLFETTLNISTTPITIISITITAQIGTITGYSTSPFQIEVYPWGDLNVNYGQNGNNSQQTFDIYGPSGNNQTFPVVVTIHGGGFTTGQKEYYNYITPFLINNGCIHVNMNYRLMPQNPSCRNTDIAYYQLMLNDINSLIGYILSDNYQYRNKIDPSQIILMGHSAGGNLALYYASNYYVVEDNNPTNNITFKAVITEGTPTFSDIENINGNLSFVNSSYVSDINILNDIPYLLRNSISLNRFQLNTKEISIQNLLVYQGVGFSYGDLNENPSLGDAGGDSLVPKNDTNNFVTNSNQLKCFYIKHDKYDYAMTNNINNINYSENYKDIFDSFLGNI